MTDSTQTINTQQVPNQQIFQQEAIVTKVKFSKSSKDMVCSGAPATKSIKGKNEKYKTLPLLYNFGTVERPMLDQYDMEGKKVKCYGGILVKVDPENGRTSYSVKITYNVNTDQDVIKANTDAWEAAAAELDKNRGYFTYFNKLVSDDGRVNQDSFKCPVYFPRDEATMEIIPGRNPTQYLKLINYGTGYSAKQTTFSIPKVVPVDAENPSAGEKVVLEPIDWNLLYGVDLELIPVYRFESVYYGAKPSLQVKMASAIVTSMAPGVGADQLDTAQHLVTQDANLAGNLAKQLESLRMAFRESGSLPQQTPEQNGGQQGTDNTNQPGMQTMTTAPPVQTQQQQQFQIPPQTQQAQPSQTQQVQPSPPKETQSLQTILSNQQPVAAPQIQLQVAPPQAAPPQVLPQVQVAPPQAVPPQAMVPQVTVDPNTLPAQIQLTTQPQQSAASWD